MSEEGRALTVVSALPSADRPDGGDGGRREIDVKPEEVFQRLPPGPQPRWAHRSFFAPIAAVIGVSAALLYGLILIGGLLWRVFS